MHVIHELQRLNMDETFRFEYDNEIVQKIFVNSAKDEGFDDGVQQGIIKSIKAFFDQSVSLDVIAKANQMTIDKVKKY